MKFLIIDDEPILLNYLAQLLYEIDENNIVEKFDNSEDLLNFIQNNDYTPDVAMLDIEMSCMNGLELARMLKSVSPDTKIIFVTAYPQYSIDAINTAYASGYILKPVLKYDIVKILNHIFDNKPKNDTVQKVRCFGNFEVFYNDKPLKFESPQSKELFAFLIDRKGAVLSTRDIANILASDKPYDRNVKNTITKTISRLRSTFKAINCEDVLIKNFNALSVDISKIDCDYINYLKGNKQGINSYMGEYMSEYSWAELTNGMLSFNND